ncbi:MAG: hypothetical protein M3O46_04915 [Myxococcota bacterium]|nr:hypothetical protein [Myxococcota bacterium]
MHRHDEIDATLAKHFAWTFVRPGDSVQLTERLRAAEAAAQLPSLDATAAVGVPAVIARDTLEPVRRPPLERAGADRPADRPAQADEGAPERSRMKAQAACRALATAIAEAWSRSDEEASLNAAKRLLARADRLGIELWEMHEWPVEAVRLLRLLVRWAPKMTRRQRERSASVATLVPIDHPEASELLVEIARAGDRVIADALLADDEWAPDVGDVDALAARLADVVDDGPTHTSRAIAIAFIARAGTPTAAVPALRRGLHLPSFAVRAQALDALAVAQPCPVEPGDLVRVLRDLVAHAVPGALSDDDHEENERIFAEAILAVLEYVRPDEAAEALLDWIDAEHDALWLDAGWATEALAIAFPETSAAMVDHWLKCARAYDRTKALAALERLPDELARPRLQLAATDPSPSVRDVARQQWLQRFGGLSPADPLPIGALTGASLLSGPPSDRFSSRLLVMQGRVAEARLAMSRALIAEAPDREALVLLLQLAGDDAISNEPLSLHDAASQDQSWAVILVERFGGLGIEGLCALANRFPEPESFGWMRRLGDLVERGTIAREQAAPLRALAAHHVASEDAGAIDDSVRLLTLVGAPPELVDRALRLALDVDLASSAARELILTWPDRGVDARLASEMALAIAERDWARVQRTASVALGRGSPAARVIAQRVLEIAEDDQAAVEAAVECAHHMRKLNELDDAWALLALGRPESPIFTVAARVWRRSIAARSSLEAALLSPARGGAARAEAAIALLWGDPPLSPRDRRLSAVLGIAPPVERAELVHAMCIQGAPLAHVAPHLEELLASSDVHVTHALVGVAHWLRSPKAQGLLRNVLPRIVDQELRTDIEDELGTSDVPYWVEG